MALTADSVQQQLDNFFATIAGKVADDVVGKALPLIGKLTDMPGVAEALDPFATLKQNIHDAVESAKSAAGDPGQAIADAITSAGIPGVVSATWSSATGLDVTFHADKTVTTGTKLVDLGDSVGTFLDFDVNTGATFVASLDTTVSFGTDGKVSLKDQATPDVDVKIGTDLSVVDAGASLGVATVTFNDADPTKHELNADFGLDLKLDGAGNFTVDPTLSGSAGLDLKFATTNVVAGLLPDVKGEFVVDFGIAGGDFAAPTIAVNHLTVDLSSYLGIVGSTFTDIAKTFNSGALGTMVDIATEPVPAFDGLARTFGLLGQYDKAVAGSR